MSALPAELAKARPNTIYLARKRYLSITIEEVAVCSGDRLVADVVAGAGAGLVCPKDSTST